MIPPSITRNASHFRFWRNQDHPSCVCVCVCVFVNCPPVTALMMSGELGDSDLEVPSGHVISEAESTARINEGKDAAELKLLKEAQVRKQMIMTGR